MPKKKKKSLTRRTPQSARAASEGSVFKFSSHRVTYDPLPNPVYEALPAEIRRQLSDLHHRKGTDSESAIQELVALKQQFPHVPQIYNYLAFAYRYLGDVENAEKAILEEYQRFPEYLFGRIDYAELCLSKMELHRIPEIFETFVLERLYPERDVFHISEVMAFNHLMARYCIYTMNLLSANAYYQEMASRAPDDPRTAQIGTALKKLAEASL